MRKTYSACGKKSWKHGCDPYYTNITIEDGVAVSCMIGNQYAGCSCRLDERPDTCTPEKAKMCINEIIGYLNDDDISEIGNIELPVIKLPI